REAGGTLAARTGTATDDGAVAAGPRLAMTTDSFVVSPLFFPGGDIGSLAIHGTVNDLAMCGATPRYLSVAFILEEGLSMETLWRVVQSMAAAARKAGVRIVTGDTKVVERGKGDGLYINTTGIGVVAHGIDIAPRRACVGDVVLLSGDIAAHGMAIMSVREGLRFDSPIVSDSAALGDLVAGVLEVGGEGVHVLRDPTRGGVASALNEIAQVAGVGIEIDEDAIPVDEPVRGACELLGLDPLYVANEGKCVAIVSPQVAEAALLAMQQHPLGKRAVRIGEVVEAPVGKLILRTTIGGQRVVGMMSGEQLPRIC
ncbi:MAG: hydrogenase expression/formation protein HypE, partial [Myxococcota bacterium]